MNEIEKAIEAIEIGMINGRKIQGWVFHEVRHEPLLTALAALREKAEREKGCGYCGQVSKSIDNGEDGNSRAILYLPANNKHIHYMDAKGKLAIFDINYCPMCGRELEVNNE